MESRRQPARGWLAGYAVLLVGGCGGQVALAQRYASAGRHAAPVVVAAMVLGSAAGAVFFVRARAWQEALLRWLGAGAMLALGAGAWALLPAAWLLALIVYRSSTAYRAPGLVWYLLGFVAGAAGWAVLLAVAP